MRLGQLIRHLDIESAQAVKFLAKQGIVIQDHPNTKLEEDQVEKLLANFKTSPVQNKENRADEIVFGPKDEVSVADNEFDEFVETAEEIVAQGGIGSDTVIEIEESITIAEITKSEVSEVSKEDFAEKVITLSQEEVEKLVTSGEILSEIEAEAASLGEEGLIKAKTVKLEGLSVKGKIELPHDPRREKKELARKAQEEVQKIQSNAGKTIDGVHPNKRAKEEGERIKEELAIAEEKAKERLERAKARQEREAQKESDQLKKAKKKKKKSYQTPIEKALSPEELKKKAAREKRQRIKEKENAPKESKSFWKSLVDFFK
jgi:hypothetical protein